MKRIAPFYYLIRVAAFAGLLLLLADFIVGLGGLVPKLDHSAMASLLGQADIFRSYFHVFSVSLLFLIFLPAAKLPVRARFLLPISIAAGGITFYLFRYFPEWTRPRLEVGSDVLAAASFVAANVSLFTWFHFGGRWTTARRRVFLGFVGAADLLAPPLVWSAYEKQNRVLRQIIRPIPMLLVCLVPLWPWLRSPLPSYSRVAIEPPAHEIDRGSYYQVLANDRTGELIVVDDFNHKLIGFSPEHPENRRSVSLVSERTQVLGVDEATRKLIYLAPEKGVARVHDMDTLNLVETITWEFPITRIEASMTFWYPEKRVLGALFSGALRVCPDGKTTMAERALGQAAGFEYSARQGEIYFSDWSDFLVALDPETMETRRRVVVPRAVERLAIDEDGGRLFAASPLTGEVVVIDLVSFQVAAKISTLPGVRIITVDRARNWLILTGFTPFLEIRSLRDYSLVNRFLCPNWARWVSLDSTGKKAYVASIVSLWSLDLDAAGQFSLRRFFERADPFFFLFHYGNRLVHQRFFDMGDPVVAAPVDFRRVFHAGPCPAGEWIQGESVASP